MGTRLGRPLPKPLTRLASGQTIIQRQLENLRRVFGADVRITVVVGFKHDLVMEHVPDAVFVYNESYDQTNTSKSLLKALRASHEGSVLWMNGDVVFDPEILARLTPAIVSGRSAVTVSVGPVGEEEVKYSIDSHGRIRCLSKVLEDGLGEAVGINIVGARDKAALIRALEECDDADFFERGIELAIERDRIRVEPVDVSDLFVVEVDFDEDLERANAGVRGELD